MKTGRQRLAIASTQGCDLRLNSMLRKCRVIFCDFLAGQSSLHEKRLSENWSGLACLVALNAHDWKTFDAHDGTIEKYIIIRKVRTPFGSPLSSFGRDDWKEQHILIHID